jgi:hypothetical protein
MCEKQSHIDALTRAIASNAWRGYAEVVHLERRCGLRRVRCAGGAVPKKALARLEDQLALIVGDAPVRIEAPSWVATATC